MKTERKVTDEVEGYFANIVGMSSAKKSFQLLLDTLEFERIRMDRGYLEPIVKNLNYIICGGRGVGKTKLADILVRFLKEKVLQGDYTVLSVMARNLDNRQYRENLLEICEQEKRILIIENIDEYLDNTDICNSVRRDTVLSISDTMKEKGKEAVFIITGSNSGIDSLSDYDPTIYNYIFDTISIENYTTDELWQMMQYISEESQLHMDEACGGLVKKKLSAQSLVADFLNGTIVERYKNESVKRLASNYFKKHHGHESEIPDDKDLSRIGVDEIPFDATSEKMEQCLAELEALTGLEEAKKRVRDQLNIMMVAIKNEQMGLSSRRDQTLHMVFKGNPGTGKTTVAKILGSIYCQMGVLPNGDQEVKVVSRAELIGEYVGETAKIVKKVCENADGGVLFIDEAYSLINSERDSFGHEAVDTLIQEMENRRSSMMVILAGYNDEMDKFLKSNPGFRSRIPESNDLYFEDYTSEQMVSIFKKMIDADGYGMKISDDIIKELIETRSKNPGFGNARGVRNLVQDVETEQNIRVCKSDENAEREKSEERMIGFERKIINEEDIRSVSDKNLQGVKTIDELLDELKKLVGLHGVKKQVQDIVRSVEYADILKNRGIESTPHTKTMHLIFSGNPGTGKSTIASMLGEIYVRLGVLKKNTFILAKRENLVGQYQGHTAAQVASKVAEADGGILFIDEAYQLCLDKHDMFGMEAIGTLLSLAEEKRDSLMIVLAGYKEDMERFLKTNPGLKSRFPRAIEFEDYSLDELVQIFKYMCTNEKMRLDDGVTEKIKDVIEKRKSIDTKEFGNARGVRNIVDEVIIKQNSRIVSDKEKLDQLSNEELFIIRKEDVADE